MKKGLKIFSFFAFSFMFLLLSLSLIDSEQVSRCMTISSPGEYSLTQDINISLLANCIVINSDDVTFDCNNFGLYGGRSNYGIVLNNKSNVIIKNCLIENFITAISVQYGKKNTFENNNILFNDNAIRFQYSSDNYLFNSEISNNTQVGIILVSSFNNIFYANLLNNLKNFQISGMPYSNYWNNSEGIGNHWLSPSGTGFSQTCPDKNIDGICDLPYNLIKSNNTDYFPSKDTSTCSPKEEICNNMDDDCDNLIDDGLMENFFLDYDKDGFGNPSRSILICSPREGYIKNNTDCDDNSKDVSPEATEVCNGIDDNCDNIIDEGFSDFDNDSSADCVDLDDDNDGLNDAEDLCSFENPDQLDANKDGCIDKLENFSDVINKIPPENIDENVKGGLLAKINNALKSKEKGNNEASTNILNAFVNEVNAQIGKKIVEEVGEMLTSYAENVIIQIRIIQIFK